MDKKCAYKIIYRFMIILLFIVSVYLTAAVLADPIPHPVEPKML